jgi:hypothetical protein
MHVQTGLRHAAPSHASISRVLAKKTPLAPHTLSNKPPSAPPAKMPSDCKVL